MTPSPFAPYLPLAVVVLLAAAMGALVSSLSSLLGPKNPNPVKSVIFEAGSEPAPGTARQRFAVKFYVVALLISFLGLSAVISMPTDIFP